VYTVVVRTPEAPVTVVPVVVLERTNVVVVGALRTDASDAVKVEIPVTLARSPTDSPCATSVV
jgi:hypothetical protein